MWMNLKIITLSTRSQTKKNILKRQNACLWLPGDEMGRGRKEGLQRDRRKL
jgi:hypothetical protein